MQEQLQSQSQAQLQQQQQQSELSEQLPTVSTSAVLAASDSLPESTPKCKGVDFSKMLLSPSSNDEQILDEIMKAFKTTGFQATNLGLAVDQINEMRKWRLSDIDWKEGDDEALKPPEIRNRIRARIFLAYTSNQISSGQREIIRFLVQNKMVDCIVTTGGGIEEDIIKCFQPTYMGDFKLSGRELRKKGINRIGNLLIPNNNYCEFEDWLTPLIHQMHKEQNQKWMEWLKEMNALAESRKGGNVDDDVDFGIDDYDDMPYKFVWTPSKVIHRLGKELESVRNHEESVLYWAAKNNIPIFCPALTDGSLGDMLYFHSYKKSGFILDIAEDIRHLNDIPVKSHATGMIILGGGVVKHHTCNANLMRNGADFSVYINTGQEFDGSDSGASPDEAISWGKIRMTANPVKVSMDATVAFPLIVSQTFAKNVEEWKESVKNTVCHIDDLD